jgi:hypothetical protein
LARCTGWFIDAAATCATNPSIRAFTAGANEPDWASSSITTTAIRTIPHRVTVMQEQFEAGRITPLTG